MIAQLAWPLFSLQDHKHLFVIRSHATVSYYMHRFQVLSQLMQPFQRGSYRRSPVRLRHCSAASWLTVWGFNFPSWFLMCSLSRHAPSYLSNTHTKPGSARWLLSEAHLSCDQWSAPFLFSCICISEGTHGWWVWGYDECGLVEVHTIKY